MRVFNTAGELPRFRNPAVTVGSFDGVHCGHRILLDRLQALKGDGESVVVTFSPHPRQVLPRGGDIKLLNTLPEKILLLEEAGLDNLVVIPFTPEFAGLSYSDFVGDILVDRIGMKSFVVGFDHRFGRDQQGDSSALANLGDALGFRVEEVPRHDSGLRKVSSSAVREHISAGDMEQASLLLGRPYILIADVANGRVTVPDKVKLLPPPGNYRAMYEYNGETVSDMLAVNAAGELSLAGWNGRGDSGNVIISIC